MAVAWLHDIFLITAAVVTSAPFVAFVLIMVFFRTCPRVAAVLALTAITGSFLGAVFLLGRLWHLQSPLQYIGRWLVSGDLTIPFGFLLDPDSLLMLTIVALISLLVQLYSLGYMAGDGGFSRYYAFMSLFAWAMMSLAISPNMLQLYVFWELVGLSSYLLIGFWYEKFSATQAGKKAFVMTRLGDVAFFLGLLLVLVHFGNLDILELNRPQAVLGMSPKVLTVAALLIFGGIIGKSAQFPLLTWLPDAMEGPTPVSALLHSATMVAAGVYLFARLFPFFSNSPAAMTIFLLIGTISMLLAATMAMVSRDIKQIWAYSTISQLGFMIMGLAAGGYFAGVFHLTTHAGFKALLFLCSGVFIHFCASNDVFDISRQGGRRFKIPMVCITLAAAALAGLPPLSGFFSKELILAALAGLNNPVWLAAGLLGVFLTSYYAFRLIFIILFPRKSEPLPESDPDHGHGVYWVMAWPLVILASVSVLLGFIHVPLEAFLADRLFYTTPNFDPPAWLPLAALGLATLGVILAWLEFGRSQAARIGFAERIAPLHALFAERWYLDRFYRRFLDVVVYRTLSNLCTRNDNRIIDGGLDGLSRGTVASGGFVSFLHLGIIQHRLLVIFVVMGFLSLYFFL